MPAGRDAGHHAHQDLLSGVPRHDRRQPGDLGGVVDDDPADPEAYGRMEVLRALRVAVHDDPLGGEARGDGESQLPGRADVEPEPLLADPAGDGAAQERLGGVDDVRLGGGEDGTVGTAAPAHLVLVQDVHGRAEPVGGLGERHSAHGHIAAGHGAGGGGPDIAVTQGGLLDDGFG